VFQAPAFHPNGHSIDREGRLITCEHSGRCVSRIEHDGTRTVVLDRLNYPTAMVFSRAGDLYIAVNGAWSAPGQGTILKIACDALGAPTTCPRR